MIHEEIVTYEVARLAKVKGFDVPTRTIKVEKIEGTEKEVWDEEECRYITQWETRSVRIPTQSLLQRWMREIHAIDIDIYPIFPDGEPYKREYGCQVYAVGKSNKPFRIGYAKTYENMLESALKYALENLV